MIRFINSNGDMYMVLRDSKVGKFKPHRCRAGRQNWDRIPAFPWRESEVEAEADLKKYASENGMKEISDDTPSASEPAKRVLIPHVYRDSRGWTYKVMPGLGGDSFKARYKKPGKGGWKCCSVLPWRDNEADAQADLDAWAKAKGMKEEGELLA